MIIFAALWAAAAGDALSPTAAISAEGLSTKTPAKVRCRGDRAPRPPPSPDPGPPPPPPRAPLRHH